MLTDLFVGLAIELQIPKMITKVVEIFGNA
jgi:hypothetical protein